MIQTWKEVSYTLYDTLWRCTWLTNNREDTVVDGRSGRNRLYAYNVERNGSCTICLSRRIMGAHSKGDGVIKFWRPSLNAWMYSTYISCIRLSIAGILLKLHSYISHCLGNPLSLNGRVC